MRAPPRTSGLSVAGMTVRRGGTTVLTDVDLRAEPGTRTAVIGPNGAGKSTLLRAIAGLVPPSAGTVHLDGQPAARHRAGIALVAQRAEVDFRFPAQVRDVVAMGRHPHRRLLRRATATDREAVDEAVQRLELSELVHRPIGSLSGGQAQRTLLARALAQRPRLLLLDEPFAGLDARSMSLLSDAVAAEAARGVVVVVVHHDLASVGQREEHLVVLRGRVIAAGPPSSTLTAGVVADAYGGVPPLVGWLADDEAALGGRTGGGRARSDPGTPGERP